LKKKLRERERFRGVIWGFGGRLEAERKRGWSTQRKKPQGRKRRKKGPVTFQNKGVRKERGRDLGAWQTTEGKKEGRRNWGSNGIRSCERMKKGSDVTRHALGLRKLHVETRREASAWCRGKTGTED